MLLELFGYQVIYASNAREAVSRALSSSLDCIILSSSLPGGDALEILRSLRGLTGKHTMPVVLIIPPDVLLEESAGFIPTRDQRLIPTFRPVDLLKAVQCAAQPNSAQERPRSKPQLTSSSEQSLFNPGDSVSG